MIAESRPGNTGEIEHLINHFLPITRALSCPHSVYTARVYSWLRGRGLPAVRSTLRHSCVHWTFSLLAALCGYPPLCPLTRLATLGICLLVLFMEPEEDDRVLLLQVLILQMLTCLLVSLAIRNHLNLNLNTLRCAHRYSRICHPACALYRG